MPPKRKRIDAQPEPASSTGGRSMRSSARSGAETAGTNSTAMPTAQKPKSKAREKFAVKDTTRSKSKKKVDKLPEFEPESEEETPEPSSKKGKKLPATPGGTGNLSNNDVPIVRPLKPPLVYKQTSPLAVSGPKLREVVQRLCRSHDMKIKRYSPYTKTRMEQLFANYADEDQPSVVGGEGLEKLCIDASISMEGAQPLLFAWLLDASELGRLTKEEWVKGLDALQIDTLDKLGVALAEHEALLISNRPAPKPPASSKKSVMEPYNRTFNYWGYAADVPKAFLKFYTFVFSLAKAPQARNIDIETAKAFWVVLLAQKYPIVNNLIEFINEKGTVRGANKDLWTMTLDFCRSIKPTFEDYETDGAWPTLLDEFVAWQKARQSLTVLPDGEQGVE